MTTGPGSSRPPELRTMVVMLTYRRPDDLQQALARVIEQLGDAPGAASLLVVDNDPDAGALPIVAEAGDGRVRAVHEPVPGIAAARNRGLAEAARAHADLLVFIDDDERPEPGWLRSLVETWQGTRAAAVVGPVVSEFAEGPERWIREGGFFDRRRHATGDDLSVAATNNLLLDLGQVRRLDVHFDPAFSSGGSDTLFTRTLRARGGRMVWCAEAVVVDAVPAERLTRNWVLRRALRSGNSWSRTSVALAPSRPRSVWQRITLTGQGVARIAAGVLRVVAGFVIRSERHRAQGARTLARGVGMLTGAWGYVYGEYRSAPSTRRRASQPNVPSGPQ